MSKKELIESTATDDELAEMDIAAMIGDMLIIPGQIASPTGLRDRTMKFTIYCQELPPDKAGKLMSFNESVVNLAINPNPFRTEQIKMLAAIKASGDIGKTPSERLHSVLYVLWKNEPQGYEDFNLYYEYKMNQIINHFKSKLPRENH